MTKIRGISALFFALVFSIQIAHAADVTVSTPASGANVSSPFNLQAQSSTCSGQPVAAMAYSIGNGSNSTPVSATSLNVQVSASVGQNQVLHVKSWGNQGSGCDTDITFSVAAPIPDGITVSSPANLATLTSPFSLQARSITCDGQPVAAMAYSIGNGPNSTPVSATSLTAQVSASAGLNQILHVKSWGNQGAGCDVDITFNVAAPLPDGVVVSTPTNGATLTSPFSLQAQSLTCSGQPVAAMAYSIGNGSNSTPVSATSLTAHVSVSAGLNQILHVKSWGNQGAGCDTDVTFNVASPPAPSPSPSVANGVTVSAPVSGATVSSPFTLQAQSLSCSGQPVAAMAYSIGNGANSTAVNSTSLNAQVSASLGANQILHVKSWGNQGAGCDTDVTINVIANGFDGSANIPNPPASASNVDKIQELTGWSGETGAASQCPNGVATSSCDPVSANFNSTPALSSDPIALSGSDGISGEFQLYQSPAYATAIWGHQVLTQAAARNFIWDFYIYVNSASYGASELDLYTSLNNGQRFMMGSQCNRNNNTWDTWSESGQTWIHNTNIPCNTVLSAGVWHHVTFYNTVNTSNNTYTYQTLRIDEVDYVLNQTQSAKEVGWPDGVIGVQVQLDANFAGNGVYEYLENMQIYAW